MDTVAEVVGIEKNYGPVRALNRIDFAVSAGEVVGFLGPNGAGKTTAMKILTGYLQADAGTARVCGHDVEAEPVEAKEQVGYLPENNPLYLDQRVQDYLAFVCDARSIVGSARPPALDRVVDATDIAQVYRRPIGELSKGYRQRVGLAQALLHDPPLLILDEPTNGLDPNQVVEIRELIRTLGKTKTVLLSSHVMPEVQALCDRVILLNEGSIVADGSLESLTRPADDLAVRLVLRADASALDSLSADGRELVEVKQSVFGDAELVAGRFHLQGGLPAVERLATAAAGLGVPVLEIAPQVATLEDLFRQRTAGEVLS